MQWCELRQGLVKDCNPAPAPRVPTAFPMPRTVPAPPPRIESGSGRNGGTPSPPLCGVAEDTWLRVEQQVRSPAGAPYAQPSAAGDRESVCDNDRSIPSRRQYSGSLGAKFINPKLDSWGSFMKLWI
eukprot:gene17290-biopygen3797